MIGLLIHKNHGNIDVVLDKSRKFYNNIFKIDDFKYQEKTILLIFENQINLIDINKFDFVEYIFYKQFSEYLDNGQTLSMHSFHTDHFDPVVKDLANPEKSKKLLEDRKKILGLEDLSVIIDEESPVEITREFYDVKMQELKSKLENAEKESLTIQDLIKSFKMAKEAITIIIVGSQLMTKAYGDPVSKQGRPYKYDPFWIYEEWEKAFAKYPEKIHQWTKALKTRTGNIIREEKNFNSLRFFIDFLVKKHLEESVSIIDEYRKPDNHINNLRTAIPEIDINIDEIPF